MHGHFLIMNSMSQVNKNCNICTVQGGCPRLVVESADGNERVVAKGADDIEEELHKVNTLRRQDIRTVGHSDILCKNSNVKKNNIK